MIDSNNKTYLVGLYRTVPNADVYIDHISLESNGEKYKNLYEFKVKPVEITSIKDLTNKLPDDGNYEITTTLSVDSLSSKDLQKISSKILNDSKRESIKSSDYENELSIKKATKQNLEDADSVLGNIDAASYEITIRLYDATESQINEINKNFDVINMRTF